MTPILEARGLHKAFGAVTAAAALNVEVAAGEIHAVIGPNGAGKTTLVSLLTGELRPDSGQILLEGRDVTALPVHRRAGLGIGRTFQLTNVLPSFSVLANVALAVQARTRLGVRILRNAASDSAINAKALATLDRLSIGHLAERPAGSLAHGERRLVELAMALGPSPKVLLLDEPLAGVAPGEAEQVLAILARIRGEVPILLVEHDMDAVFRLADRITVLVHGRAIATGTPAEVRADPEVRAAYLG